MKLNKFLVALVVIVVCIGCVAFVGCKKKTEPSGDNYPVVQDTSKVNVYFMQEVVTTQQEFAQNGLFYRCSCEYDEIKDAEEGLFTFLDMQTPKLEYTYNGSILTKAGTLTLSTDEENEGYRIVVFTTVKADQDTTAIAKRMNYGNYTLVNTNKAPTDVFLKQDA